MVYQFCFAFCVLFLSFVSPVLCKLKCSRCDSVKLFQFKGKYITEGLKTSACDKYSYIECSDNEICAVDAVYKQKSDRWTLITGCKARKSDDAADLNLKCTVKTLKSLGDKSIKCTCATDNCNEKSAESLLAAYKAVEKEGDANLKSSEGAEKKNI